MKPISFLEIDKLKNVLTPIQILEGGFYDNEAQAVIVPIPGTHDIGIKLSILTGFRPEDLVGTKAENFSKEKVRRCTVRALFWLGCFETFGVSKRDKPSSKNIDFALKEFSWPKASESSVWEKTLTALVVKTSKLESVPNMKFYLTILRAFVSLWADLTPSGLNRVKTLITKIIIELRDRDTVSGSKDILSWFKTSERFDITLDSAVRHMKQHPRWKGLVLNHLLSVHVLSDDEEEPDILAYLLNETEKLEAILDAEDASEDLKSLAIGYYLRLRPVGAKAAHEKALSCTWNMRKRLELLDASLGILTKEKETLEGQVTLLKKEIVGQKSTISKLKEKLASKGKPEDVLSFFGFLKKRFLESFSFLKVFKFW